MLIPELDLAKDLLYRGEGNSSLVIAFTESRQVLRLLKAKELHERDVFAALRQHVLFNETTISAILPKELFSIPKIVKLSETQIRLIEEVVRDKRPQFRRHKTLIDGESDTFALLLPDYCCLPREMSSSAFGPVIGVEIKPKQGFLPEKHVLSEELEIKSRVCRYGLSQFHKRNKGSVSRISDYCPLDLFSGCPQRQTNALKALIDCPQNNFRVFRDVIYAFGEETNSQLCDVIHDFVFSDSPLEAFCALLVSALSLPLSASKGVSKEKYWPQSCSLHSSASHRCHCDSPDHSLVEGSVLESILLAQKLDSIDSYLANEMSLSLMENNNNFEINSKTSLKKEKLLNESQKEFFNRKIWQFLVSLTAKDCSIMISMQRSSREDSNIRFGQNSYSCSVRITDLDEKMRHKISRTLSNDKRMVKAFESSL